MRITVVTVTGKRVPWVDAGVADYLRRFSGRWRVALKEVKAEPRRDAVERMLLKEKERLLGAIEPPGIYVALDERGELWSTTQLAEKLRDWEQSAGGINFLIGGPDGFHPTVPAAATARFSLSRLTLAHGMARLVLAEQLYRAWSVLQGHPYHRE